MSEIETGGQEPEFAAFVGIDWADRKHVWCLQSRDSTKRETGELEHTPEAVEAWVAQLCQRFGNRPIAVALEQSRGSLVFMLAKYEPLHLFPVPSTMSASMRKALYPSGSKDDPRDADVLLDLLLQHCNKLRRLSPDTEATRRIQNLVEERRKLVDEKTEHTNRLTSHLKIYFPQMLNWFEHLDTELVCALLEHWPTLEELRKVPPAKLRTFFSKHHCRNQELIEQRLLAIHQSIPAIRDRAVIEAKSATDTSLGGQVCTAGLDSASLWFLIYVRRWHGFSMFSISDLQHLIQEFSELDRILFLQDSSTKVPDFCNSGDIGRFRGEKRPPDHSTAGPSGKRQYTPIRYLIGISLHRERVLNSLSMGLDPVPTSLPRGFVVPLTPIRIRSGVLKNAPN
jgi:hypothetical protein